MIFSRFLIVGFLGTITNLSIFFIFVDILKYQATLISIFASEEKLNLEVLRMAENLSDIKGLKIHCIFRGSLKRKMIKANKVFSDYVILFGEEEFTQKRIVLKDLSSGEQQIISLDKTFENINGIATKIK